MYKQAKQVIRFCLLMLSGALFGCNETPPKPQAIQQGDYEAVKDYITRLIQSEMHKHDIAGLSIALVEGQEIIWAQGFGYADKNAKKPVTPETIFRAGSISKLFTNTAVMQLAEQKKIDIDRPLQMYLPAFSIKSRFVDTAPITVRNVMTHHAGLPGDLLNGMWADKPEPFTKVVSYLKHEYAAYPPNYILAYSNIGTTLLGHMIQEAVQTDFATHIDRTLLQPMGMAQSSFSASIEGPLASMAYHEGKQVEEVPLRDLPAGALNTNVIDLARFIKMVHAQGRSNDRQIIKPETLASMLAPQNEQINLDFGTQIGLGWFLDKAVTPAGMVAGHGGGTLTHRSQLLTLPKHQLGVVVLANTSSATETVNNVAREALVLALEAKTGIKQSKEDGKKLSGGTLQLASLDQYTGKYASVAGLAKIIRSGNDLKAELMGKQFELIAEPHNEFSLRYKLLGVIPLQPSELKELRISHRIVGGHEVVVGSARGHKFILAERIKPAPISEKWKNRTGEYEAINVRPGPIDFKKVRLEIEDGILTADITLKPSVFDAEDGGFAIEPISDDQAIISGLGRGKRETVQFIMADGKEFMTYSGFQFRKIGP